MTDELKLGHTKPVTYWKNVGEAEWLDKNINDPEKLNEWKEKFRLKEENKEKFDKIKAKPVMADLHATYFDANSMYDFLSNVICKEIPDITIMSEKKDFHRLFQKPLYEGDFLSQMFDWNENHPAAEKELTFVRDELLKMDAKGETFD